MKKVFVCVMFLVGIIISCLTLDIFSLGDLCQKNQKKPL